MFCRNCGAQVSDQAKFCNRCGYQFGQVSQPVQPAPQPVQPAPQPVQPAPQPIQPAPQPVQPAPQPVQPAPQPVQPAPQPVQQYVPIEEPPMPTGHGNVFMGIIGAVLFALLGGLAYVAVYQAGVIAGICGFVIFAAAGFGYRLFARTKNKYSLVSLITAIVLTVAVILVAEYVAIAVDVYMEYEANGMSLGEAFESTFNVISESGEVGEAVMEELAYAYIFGFAAIIFDVIRIVKGRNRQKQQVKQNQ